MRLTLPVTPVAQMRARSAVRGRHAMTYKTHEQRSREATLQACLMPYQPAQPIDCACELLVRAYQPRPKSKPKKWHAQAMAGIIRPTSKPDMDNLLKHLKDCVGQMRFWTDDKLVVGYLPGTGKYYDDGNGPRWEVEIRPLVVETQGQLVA